jgi:hypothetical protein
LHLIAEHDMDTRRWVWHAAYGPSTRLRSASGAVCETGRLASVRERKQGEGRVVRYELEHAVR